MFFFAKKVIYISVFFRIIIYMATKGIKLFFVLSIIFYVLLVIYLWYAFYTIRTQEFEVAADSASSINSEIDSAYSIDYSFSSDFFTENLADVFRKHKKLTAVILDSDSEGLQYIKISDLRLLGDSVEKGFNPDADLPEISPLHPFMRIYKTKLYFSNGYTVNSTIVFDLLDRKLFFPILRNALIAALIYLMLSVILLTQLPVRKKAVIDESDFEPEPERPSSELPEMDVQLLEDAAVPETAEGSLSGMYSERSGLVWEHFLSEKLDAELKRAASFDQDSCLAFISIASQSGFIPYRNISELIIEHFPYKDLAFESGEDTFCVIIPEKDIDEGQIEVEKFKKNLLARFHDSSYRVYAGLTSRNSRLLSEKRMIQEARAALNKAEEEKQSTTISFRTDLNKYREYIATTI
ncbi:MAG TPA: hypothetical protein DCO79_15910 [Spirochaeta sp.]|nr:hypothetical protein [Spirochaeta sp.]